MENRVEYNDFVDIEALDKGEIRTKILKTDLTKILNKNHPTEGLVRLVQEFAKLVTEINSKVQEFKTYGKVINHSVNRNT